MKMAGATSRVKMAVATKRAKTASPRKEMKRWQLPRFLFWIIWPVGSARGAGGIILRLFRAGKGFIASSPMPIGLMAPDVGSGGSTTSAGCSFCLALLAALRSAFLPCARALLTPSDLSAGARQGPASRCVHVGCALFSPVQRADP